MNRERDDSHAADATPRETEGDDRFRRMFEDVPLAMALTDPTFHFVEVNTAFVRLLGYGLDELRSMTFRELTHAEDLDENARQVAQLRDGAISLVRVEKRYLAKDGRVIWCHTTISTARSPGGALRNYLVMVRDITESRAREEALRSSEENYRFLVDNLNVGVFRSRMDGSFMHVNGAVAQMAAYASVEEFRGVPAAKLYANAADRERMVSALRQFGEVRDLEVTSARKDGSTYPLSITAKLMRDSMGEPNSILGIVEDLTERKKAAEALQRTQRLESLGVLAGGIAHDFNNLLAGIFGFVELARTRCDEPRVRDYLNEALGAHGRATALTQQLLTFARGGAPNRMPGSVAPVLQASARFALAGSNVSCAVELEAELPDCDFDEHQLAQVIDNVLINAQQAMPMGGTIAVTARRATVTDHSPGELRAGDYVHISVRDTGVGIPAEVLPRIFDPFFTTKQRGSGLGLAIAHSIIKRHDGQLCAESTPGQGSTFHVYLPVAREPAKPPSAHAPATHRGVGQVLVVDDEPDIRTILGAGLADLGYTPLLAVGGAEALELLQNEANAGRPVVAVFMDLTIPGGMGGREAVSELRRRGMTLPVFAMSGYSDDPVIAHPSDFGFDGSMRKPMRLRDLQELLAHHVLCEK